MKQKYQQLPFDHQSQGHKDISRKPSLAAKASHRLVDFSESEKEESEYESDGEEEEDERSPLRKRVEEPDEDYEEEEEQEEEEQELNGASEEEEEPEVCKYLIQHFISCFIISYLVLKNSKPQNYFQEVIYIDIIGAQKQ